jgi:EAL domain-containing protein (putative c-di-GMP-specific phosphodiesterase class I)
MAFSFRHRGGSSQMISSDSFHRRIFETGESLFAEGDAGEEAYLIESGQVDVTLEVFGKTRHIASLGAGEIVGEMALIDDAPRSATAVAMEPTVVFVVDRDLMRQRLASTDPVIGLLMRVLSDRLRTTQHRSREGGKSTVFDGVARRYQQGDLEAIDLIKFEHELKRGLASGQFEITLQPIVHLSDCRIAGYEALMTWRHPERGRISPASFIDIAERTGLIREMDDLALRQALRALTDIKHSLKGRVPDLRVSVNLSGVHADDAGTVERIGRVLEEESFDPEFLTLEVTESWLVEDPLKAQDILFSLKDLGLRLALDDFGTGYSSLGYLHQFPMDYLKVDKSFTEDMINSEGSVKLVTAVVGLAKTFSLRTIAEGIDDPAQIDLLRDMDCEYGQGYHFSRPLEIEDACRFAHDHAGDEV